MKDSFSSGEAVRFTGVTPRTLDYWARSRLVVPSIAEATGTGSERRYSFDDLVLLRLFREMRSIGVETKTLALMTEALRKPVDTFELNRTNSPTVILSIYIARARKELESTIRKEQLT